MTVICDIFLKGMKRKRQWVLGKQINRNLKVAQICKNTYSVCHLFRSSYAAQFKRQK